MTPQPIARLIGEAFNNPLTGFEIPALQPRRRKKLWELPARWHCPLIGTCLPLSELRRLAIRAGLDEPGLSDYMLHARVVSQCASRTEIAELIQRHLDQRHLQTVCRFARTGNADGVFGLWREALATGEVAAALWAAWSHPAIDEEEGNAIYGEIHMLSHQVGARTSVSQQRIAAAEHENARLRNELAVLHASSGRARKEQQQATADLKRRLADAERRLARRANDATMLANTRAVLASQAEREREIEARLQCVEDLGRENASLRRRIEEDRAELGRARAELAAVTAALQAALEVAPDDAAEPQGEHEVPAVLAPLAGRNVVCVGGRTRLIDRYRRVVEASGGRFTHHDGGQEESLHRIDAMITAADIVLCQSGFVSHAAYWRIKDACKRLRLPCVYLKSAGVTSFARSLESLAVAGSAGAQPN